MKLGLCTWSYNRAFKQGKMDLEKILHVCADDLKIGGVDIIDVHFRNGDNVDKLLKDTDYLLKIKKLATDLSITISAVSPGNSFGKDKEVEEKAEVEKIARAGQRPVPAVRRMMEKSGDLDGLRRGLRERMTFDVPVQHASIRG